MTTGISTGERPTPATTDDVERAAWLALATTPGLGARGIAQLIQRFGSAVAILDAELEELTKVAQVSRKALRVLRARNPTSGRELLGQARCAGQAVLVPSDPDYPTRLRTIPDPPPVLFALGDPKHAARRTVAIIGSRDHTRYGAEVARRIAEVAAGAGVAVVSGMARGLDAIAQLAAMTVGGRSIAVLGTGADVAYPRQNASLHDRLRREGLILSEHPPGEPAHHGAFPRRNRLISGLAEALVVVEAAEGSGTLITVECALEQGRDVLAVPGPINAPTSRGTNRLIRDGATPILDPPDLLAALGLGEPRPAQGLPPPPCSLGPEEARVFGALGADPTQLDDLALQVGMPIGTLLGTLLGLEIGGLVEQLPGSMFRRRSR